MNEFTASNGKPFNRTFGGYVTYDGEGDMQGVRMALTSITEQGLTELFQHERDEELGRWRPPKMLDHVVYPVEQPHQGTHSRMVNILNERTGRLIERIEGNEYGDSDKHPGATEAARAWFEAHPKPEPKPWHDAKPGEVWELSTNGVDDRWSPTVFRVSDEPGHLAFHPIEPAFLVSYLGSKATAIIAGRRIWPEPSDA